MAIVHRGRIGTRPSGGRYKSARGKRLFERGRPATLTKIGEEKKVTARTKGCDEKIRMLVAKTANVFDTKSKKFSKAVIKIVTDCPANRHFVRRNIIVKGTVIETDKGKARVTSRPGQDGVINAVLV
ncbi:30S ribosomal protein S8e [Candidatus Woesearchaeota archaeon]|nr:30S ribosomal protein S8e [Candidatus Woesearchaeota archaeon]